MLRPFGRLVYAANLAPNKGKFDSRSIKCVFLGYDIFHKGFLLFDLYNEKILIYRDVMFVLDTYVLLNNTETTTEPPISYSTVSDNHVMDDEATHTVHEPPILEF